MFGSSVVSSSHVPPSAPHASSQLSPASPRKQPPMSVAFAAALAPAADALAPPVRESQTRTSGRLALHASVTHCT